MSEYHVTKSSKQGVYGHHVKHCDPCGCAGDERLIVPADYTYSVRCGDQIDIEAKGDFIYLVLDSGRYLPVVPNAEGL